MLGGGVKNFSLGICHGAPLTTRSSILFGSPGEGSKGQISFNFNYKVKFKDFYSKPCVCVLTNERYKTYQTGFFLSPGSCPRGGTWGYSGAKIKFRPAVCPLCYLLLNHWTNFNQIWCVSYSHEWDAQHKNFFSLPSGALGRG